MEDFRTNATDFVENAIDPIRGLMNIANENPASAFLSVLGGTYFLRNKGIEHYILAAGGLMILGYVLDKSRGGTSE